MERTTRFELAAFSLGSDKFVSSILNNITFCERCTQNVSRKCRSSPFGCAPSKTQLLPFQASAPNLYNGNSGPGKSHLEAVRGYFQGVFFACAGTHVIWSDIFDFSLHHTHKKVTQNLTNKSTLPAIQKPALSFAVLPSPMPDPVLRPRIPAAEGLTAHVSLTCRSFSRA